MNSAMATQNGRPTLPAKRIQQRIPLEILSDPVLSGVWRKFQPPAILKRIVRDAAQNSRRPYRVEFYHAGYVYSVQCRLSEATSFRRLGERVYGQFGFMLCHPCAEHGKTRVGRLGRMLWRREVKLAIDAGKEARHEAA